MKICKIFPLYTFQMSSCVDARLDLKSHLTSTSHENLVCLVKLDGREVRFEKSSHVHLA